MGTVRIAAIVLFALVATAVLAGFSVLRQGLAADRAPGVLETAVARRLVLLSIPASTRAMTNPRAADRDAWRTGAADFDGHCAVCHGSDGRGQTTFGPRMYPPVPNLASEEIQQLSDGALFAIIQNGVRWTGMPAFRAQHSADDTWNLVSFIRQIPRLPPDGRDGADHAKEESDAPRGSHVIAMDGTSFAPGEVTVRVGETVTWKNADPFPHNVTSTAGGFRSGDLDPDRSWRLRVTEAGRFPYVCTLHPGMSGTLIVKP